MALTASQLAVSLFGATVGGYKTGIETFATANGETATVNALIGSSTLSGLANGVFAAKLVDLTIGSSATTANKNWLANAIEANLNAGQTKATMVTAVINALTNSALNSDANWGTAAAQFQNRVTVSDYYAAKDGASTDLTVLQNLANQVTSDATTVTTAKAAVDAGQAGYNTFSLTSNTIADVPKLTTSSDVITAAAGTLNANDVISDSTTTDNDTLNAILTTSIPTTASGPVVSNIENFNLNFKGFGLTFNANSVTNSNITVSTTQEGNTAVTLANVGATDKVTVGSGVTTLNLTSSGTTLNLTGGQSLTLDNGAAAGTMAFVSGGSSANTVTYGAANGTVKSLAVSGSQSLTIKSTDVTNDFAGNTVTKSLSGTATLTLDIAAAASADLSKVAVDSFNISAAGTQQLGLSSGANVTLSKDLAGTATLEVGALAVDGANDSLNVKVAAAQAAVTTLKNFETVNLAVATTSATTIAGITVDTTAAATVNLTGSVDTTITALVGDATASTATTLNAADFGAKLTVSGVTNAVTIVGGAFNDSIIGGAAADLIVGGAGNDSIAAGGTAAADTIIGGAGNDVITLGAANATAASSATALAFSAASINGGDGVDTLYAQISGGATLTGKLTLVENVAIHNTTASTIAWTLADTDLSAGSTLTFTLTGAGGASSALTFDGSAEKDASFNLNINAVTASSTIKTGDLADTIFLGASTDATTVITAGKGADVITLAGTAVLAKLAFAAGDSGITVATADVVNGLGVGSSQALSFSSITASGTAAAATNSQMGTGWSVTTGVATKTNATIDDFIAAATASAKAGSTGMSGQVVAFQSGADTYLFYAGTDTASNSDDGLIKLVAYAPTDITTGMSSGVFTL